MPSVVDNVVTAITVFIACTCVQVTEGTKGALAIKGSLSLNSLTFDKVISKFEAVIVRFDRTYAYGDSVDEYKNVAQAAVSQAELAVAEVHVHPYGERKNSDLAERYGIEPEHYPELRLFLHGNPEPIVYTGDEGNAEEIIKFIIRKSGLRLDSLAYIEEFDNLVKKFFRESGNNRKKVIKKAETMKNAITETLRKERATVYVKVMEKLMESGDSFLEKEMARLEKLSEGKLSDNKMAQLRDRAYIVRSFLEHREKRKKKA